MELFLVDKNAARAPIKRAEAYLESNYPSREVRKMDAINHTISILKASEEQSMPTIVHRVLSFDVLGRHSMTFCNIDLSAAA